jgi:hypothetical protein
MRQRPQIATTARVGLITKRLMEAGLLCLDTLVKHDESFTADYLRACRSEREVPTWRARLGISN